MEDPDRLNRALGMAGYASRELRAAPPGRGQLKLKPTPKKPQEDEPSLTPEDDDAAKDAQPKADLP